MKTKTLIAAIALAGNMCIYDAYAAGTITNCIKCQGLTGECSTTGSICCEVACQGGNIGETCTPSTTTTDWAGCYKVETTKSDCTTTIRARCYQGYYDKSGGFTDADPILVCTNCVICPSDGGGAYGTTSEEGAKSANKCFIPEGTQSHDDSGSFEYTQDCYYNILS